MSGFINFNVSEELLIQTAEDLQLHSFPPLDNFKKLFELFYYESHQDLQKLIKIKEYLFSLQLNHKELCTTIIYGHTFHQIAVEEHLYMKSGQHNQFFFEERTSFFSNHASSLAFSLGDKIVHFMNILDDVKEKEVKLFNLLKRDNAKNFFCTKHNDSLVKLAQARKKIKDIRHNKIHNYETELSKTNVAVTDGFVDEQPATIIMHEFSNSPIPPYQTLKLCITYEMVFVELIEELLHSILKHFGPELYDS